MHRFFVNEKGKEEFSFREEQFHYLVNVLRMKVGERLVIVTVDQLQYLGEIVEITDEVRVRVVEALQKSSESPLSINLVQGIAKGDKMDYIIQKATELGVHRIIPLLSQYTVVQLKGEKKEKKQERWQKIALAAAQQAQRVKVPEVRIVSSLQEVLEGMSFEDMGIIFYEKESKGLKEVLNLSPSGEVYVFIGPEGGWHEKEVEMLKRAGAISAGLGNRILRTETAALTALAILQYQWGDLG